MITIGALSLRYAPEALERGSYNLSPHNTASCSEGQSPAQGPGWSAAGMGRPPTAERQHPHQ